MEHRRRLSLLTAAVLVAATVPSPARGQVVRLTQDEALRLAFPPPAVIERQTAFLTEADLRRLRTLAGSDAAEARRVVTFYVATRDGRPLGTAYFDAHRVRTLTEVVMVVVSPSGTVDRIEILKFEEPPEYRARDAWLRQFMGRELDDDLAVGRGIANMTGASLTARAIVRATRRALALDRLLRDRRGEP